jgi:dTDP-4-amino-4,6-dideoxygalactose transaminase
VFEGHFRAVILPSNPETWALDPMALQRYRNKIDAAIVVSPFGYFVDTKFYDELATRLGISLVYDFAGAWGMWPRTRFPVTYSLHATKNFSCGEGGLVSYAENQEWDAGFRLHNFGFDNQGKPGILLAGNHKIDEFRAAQILAHLAKHDRILDRIEAKRRAISAYQSRLNAKPVALHNNGAPSLCVLSGLDARKIEKESARLGFKAKQYYPLLTSVPTFNKVERHGRVQECFGTHIALPSDVTAHEIDLISEQVLSLG